MKKSTDMSMTTIRFLWAKLYCLMAVFIVVLLLSLSLSKPEAIAGEDFSDYTLDKVVVLMRHGVRPQNDTAKLDQATGKKWPQWLVPDGNLSGHGYAGIVDQSRYMFENWKSEGLALSAPCPTTREVFIRASPIERTVATAQALTDGMFSGCGITPSHLPLQKKDPLFQAVEMGLAQPDPKKVEDEVMEAMGGSPEKAARKYADDVEWLRRIVCGTGVTDCQFLDEKWGLKKTKSGKYKLTGPVSAASAISETIRLQYSEGLPLQEVAFGHVKNAGDVLKLMSLHAAKYDLLDNTMEIARTGGNILMHKITDSLTAGSVAENKESFPELSAPLVIFVGHDTNISQIKTILDFHWKLASYPADDIPPGGMLIFKRYKNNKTGRLAVQLSFTARTLDEWRFLTPLSEKNPIAREIYTNPECRLSGKDEKDSMEERQEKAKTPEKQDNANPAGKKESAKSGASDLGSLCDLETFVSLYRDKLDDIPDDLPLFK
ncbi:histidine-type phosphatase [Bartonella choladocola]|uniref:4-phytase / acid phosphatase n=1 Tax=Bartonella choladocola TaxID=2750995 RepID=A0A1U9MJ04_9HYPH|nr:histidine-type phosphatase [Bartonella choladocola]AQT47836.1 4-phytase / acid phosphatase [Bartonella choladocola]